MEESTVTQSSHHTSYTISVEQLQENLDTTGVAVQHQQHRLGGSGCLA